MSTLRKLTKKGTDVPRDDIEAPVGENSPTKGDASARVRVRVRGAKYNPVILIHVIFQKVLDLLTSTDEEDLTQPSGIITVLKDVIFGVVFGVMTMSFVILLDHRDVIHIQSAHHFRNAGVRLLNDPETIANIEESSELKFMTMIDYDSRRNYIDGAEAKSTRYNEVLQKRTREAEQKREEMISMKTEFVRLYHHPLLGLTSYCGACEWKKGITCEKRVQHVKEAYNTGTIAAMTDVMLTTSCNSRSE